MIKHRGHEQPELEEHIGDVVDNISNLPDCILHHILSFMPTKEVVKTSVLSTRWKNLWAFVRNIDIDDELLWAKFVDGRRQPDVTSFVKFVERVLRLQDASHMKKFCLSCRVFRDASQIHSWISHAITHNVQELDLTLFAKDPSVIPRSMFESTSLVSLKINMNCAIELLSHVSFPCLKTLHLSFVQFLHHDFTEKLFSGCPVLEELVLLRCCFRNLKNIAISSSILKSLTICDLSCSVLFDDPTSGCKMKIDATNVTYFEYTGYLSNEIILNNTPSLHKSFIHIPNPGGNEIACRAIDLLKQVQYVVSLSLSNDTLKTLLFTTDNFRFLVFPKLTHLRLTRTVGMNHTFRVLMGLLSSCPLLQSICFLEGFMCLGGNNPIWSSIPCMSNSLKTVTFKKFHAYDSEVCFLKCILKYACVLERMDIWWSWSFTELHDVKRKRKVRKELEKTERSSTTCVINFS